MKRFFVLIATLMLVAGVADAQFLFEGDNEIGVYMVANPTAENAEDQACYTGPPGQWMVYCVLTNPVNQNTGTPMANVGGFEFNLSFPAGLFVTPVIHPSATNFMSPPDFFCGANIPVVNGQCTLITVTLGAFTATPGAVFIGPVSDPGAQSIPGAIAITDANDNFSISEAYTVAGSGADRDFSAPVMGLFDCVAVPNEDVSWGEVKTLFQ
jgi:hypothetical protein